MPSKPEIYNHLYGDKSSQTLIIDLSSSICGNCGKNADPDDEVHTSSWEHGSDSGGCGTTFKYVGSHYGSNMQSLLEKRRPDLEWIDVNV